MERRKIRKGMYALELNGQRVGSIWKAGSRWIVNAQAPGGIPFYFSAYTLRLATNDARYWLVEDGRVS